MKLRRTIQFLALVLALAGGAMVFAQSNNNVPGPTDYTRFSSFITERNIFDPNRYPRNSRDHQRTQYTQRAQRYAPMFRFVGTMSYAKGMFAFFDGNNSDLRKVLTESGSIAGYTVTAVMADGVTLQSADKKQTLHLKIGDAMRQEGSSWQFAGEGDSPASSIGAEGDTASADSSSGSSPTEAAPSPALDGNDVLKKLMQQREQELK